MYMAGEEKIVEKYYEPFPGKILVVRFTFHGEIVTRISLGLGLHPTLVQSESPISPQKELMELLTESSPYKISYSHYTAFQKKVLTEAQKIPSGLTTTYGAIASAIGCGSPRAVGRALAANTTPIIIPCHRVIRSGSRFRSHPSLGGFSQGLEIKKLLLRFEHENRCYE